MKNLRRGALFFFILNSNLELRTSCYDVRASDSLFTRATYAIKSRIRFEYPHSLSYHARILCMWGSTERVNVVSRIDECASPLKSTETSCSSLYDRIFLSGPFAASRIT